MRSIAGSLACAGVLACGPLVSESEGEGESGGATSTTGAAGTSGSAEASGLDGASGDAPSCITPVVAPALTSHELEIDAERVLVEVANLMGTPEPDLLIVSNVDVRVIPGGAGFDPSGQDAAVSDIDVPETARAIGLGPVLDADDDDIIVIDEYERIEVWQGYGDGRFYAYLDALAAEGSSPVARPVTFDSTGDDRAEVGIAYASGQLLVMTELLVGSGEYDAEGTPLDGAEWATVVPSWRDPNEPPFVLVGGYDFDASGYNLVWAPVDAIGGNWSGIRAPFTHMGDVVVDVDPEGRVRWAAIEAFGLARLVHGPLLDSHQLWESVELGAYAPYDGLELVGYPEGHELAAIVDDAIVLIDLECGTTQRLEGPAVHGQLRAADIDGDGLRDLVGRSELGVAMYLTGGA